MAYKIIRIASHGNGEEMEELNGFLRSHRVVAVEKHWCAEGADGYWHFCVEYVEGGTIMARVFAEKLDGNLQDLRARILSGAGPRGILLNL